MASVVHASPSSHVPGGSGARVVLVTVEEVVEAGSGSVLELDEDVVLVVVDIATSVVVVVDIATSVVVVVDMVTSVVVVVGTVDPGASVVVVVVVLVDVVVVVASAGVKR